MSRRHVLSLVAIGAIAFAVPAGAESSSSGSSDGSALARVFDRLPTPTSNVLGAAAVHASSVSPAIGRLREFDCAGGAKPLVVPGGLTSMGVVAIGGDGGDGSGAVTNALHDGGQSAVALGAVLTLPGETLQAVPGCAGLSAPTGSALGGTGGAGWHSGGAGGLGASNTNGGGGGGGAAALIRGTTPLAVAAGGGGAGSGGLVSQTGEGAGGNGGRNGGNSTLAPVRGGGKAPVGSANGLGGTPGGGNGTGGTGGTGGSVAGTFGPIGGGGGGGGLLGGGGGGSGELAVAYAGGGAGGRSKRPTAGWIYNPAGTGGGTAGDGAVLTTWVKDAIDGPAWPGQDIARGVATHPNRGGYVVDLFGGIHRFRQNGVTLPPAAIGGPYWPGWDIVRSIAVMPNGSGGFVLDAFGGLHGFKIGSGGSKPIANHGPYWPGMDIARGVVIVSPDIGIVMDLYGAAHLFGINGTIPSSLPPGYPIPYTPGVDRVRGVTVSAGEGGLEIDSFGNIIPWGLAPTSAPAPGAAFANPFGGQARARGIAVYGYGFPGGYVLAGDGSLLRFSPVPLSFG